MQTWSASQARAGKRIGFVPTMGYLHEGHLALVKPAAKENDVVVVSIFVNPTQFGPNEDFSKYPRDLKRDLALLKKAGVDAVFVPSAKTMYPDGVKADVIAGPLSKPLEGAFRKGHFDGVCTVVAKLFDVVRPTAAYFGQKDFQQTLVIRDMVARRKIPVRIVVCPTVREADGLAKSSRNVYLSPEERAIATVLHQALLLAKKDLKAGEPVGKVEATAVGVLALTGFRVQYFAVCDVQTLKPVGPQLKRGQNVVVAVAAYLGKTRLIDNVVFLF